jgi:hypothetical protein
MNIRSGSIGEFLAKLPKEPGALYGNQHDIEITWTAAATPSRGWLCGRRT